LAFIAFLPLFELEKQIRMQQLNSKLWLFVYAWIAMIVWNAGTVWWIWNASSGGAIAAFFINSAPMLLPFMLMHSISKKTGKTEFGVFIGTWICMELMQFHWDLAFPWLILGNTFAVFPHAVQWFEYTGVLGGSFWILMVNKKVFEWFQIRKIIEPVLLKKKLFNLVFVYFFLPALFSYLVLQNLRETMGSKQVKTASIVVVQPNIDPYKEKFKSMPIEQLEKMIYLAEKKITPSTQFVLFPETALQGGINEGEIENEYLIKACKEFLNRHPGITLLTGADSYKTFPKDGEKRPITARFWEKYQVYIDSYNTALLLTGNDSVSIYHKNKMVPGVEKMPYPQIFGFLENMAIDLGGTSGSLGFDGESMVFNTKQRIGLAPVICYESVFPDFLTTYINKGTDIICIITNDGWWGNTPGFAQHFSYARLRAIETRRPVARSANTGISGFIDEEGNVLQASAWWTEDALSQELKLLPIETIYVKYCEIINLFIMFYFLQIVVKIIRFRKLTDFQH
jgi:apolipoprotein N-acyltransferase